MPNLSELKSRMKAVEQNVTHRATGAKYFREEEAEADVKDQGTVDDAPAVDISQNAVFKIMQQKELSSDERIEAIVNYLQVQGDDFASARSRFDDFTAYFNYEQAQGMKLEMEGQDRLIAELKKALKPEVEQIVRNLTDVQEGINQSKKLLDVMRTARLEGKTIEQIKFALDANEALLGDIEKLTQSLTPLKQSAHYSETALNEALDQKIASEHGFWNGLVRSVLGPDKDIAAAITQAQASLKSVQDAIEAKEKEISAKKEEKDVAVETGPLVILRSIDATEAGFSQTIIKTAEDSLKLIRSATKSVNRLLDRMAYSKKAALEISESISKAEVREAILEGAVGQLSTLATEKADEVQKRVDAADAVIKQTTDPVELAALKAERVAIAELSKTARAFKEDVGGSHSNFAKTEANSEEARSRQTGLWNLLLVEEDMLQQVYSRTLPETARALRMGLEVNVGMQTAELASSIAVVTQRAIEAGKSAYADLAQTQDDLRAADLKIMEDAINALTNAQESVVTAAEAASAHSGKRKELTTGLVSATNDLRGLLEVFDDIRARSADANPVAGEAAAPAAATTASIEEGPRAPARPANDRGTAPRPIQASRITNG